MIASSINISVDERTKFFGMLRCIGASKKQIIRLVRYEALNLCKNAIPIGIALGVFVTWGLCAILHYIIGGEFSQIPIWGISTIGLLFGMIVGLLTVVFAAQAPAKRAARVSPIAAVSGDMNMHSKNRHAARLYFRKIETSLGINHATTARKNIILMIGSFALSVIVFLSFSVTLDFVRKALPEFRESNPDISIASKDYSCEINAELINKIDAISNVKCSFGRMFMGNIPVTAMNGIDKIDLISYEQNQMKWAKKDVLCGDISKIKDGSNYVMAEYNKYQPLNVGDKFSLYGTEVEVAALLSATPFSSNLFVNIVSFQIQQSVKLQPPFAQAQKFLS